MTTTELKQEKQELCKFEIAEMQKVYDLMKSEKWNEVDLQLTLKNPEEWKAIISKFNFRDCIPEKYIVAMKKLCILAFEDGIKQKEKELNQFK